MSRAVALRQSFATVSCPICEQDVEAPFINIHLDSGCTKHGSRRRDRDDSSDSELHVQSGNGGRDSRFDRVGSPKRRRLQPEPADNPALGSRSATATIASSTTPKVFPMFEGLGISRQRQTASDLAAEAEMSRCITLDLRALPRARVYPLTQCAKSWVAHVPGWCSMSTDAFNALWERHPKQQATVVLFGQEVTCSRWTKMYGQDYVFSGQRSASSGPLSSDSDGCGPELMAAFERVCSLRPCQESAPAQPNGVLVNWYADGSHYIGPHSDDETQLAVGAPIFSISWGATRRFRLLPRRKTASIRRQKAVSDDADSIGSTDACGASGRPDASVKLDLEVANGDLIVMGGDCQKTHKHEVPKTRQLVGRRINATFRTFAKRVEANRVNGSYP